MARMNTKNLNRRIQVKVSSGFLILLAQKISQIASGVK